MWELNGTDLARPALYLHLGDAEHSVLVFASVCRVDPHRPYLL